MGILRDYIEKQSFGDAVKPTPEGERLVLGVVSENRILAAVEDGTFGLGSPGFCAQCGADAEGVEPDAEGYYCDECGEYAVSGADIWLMRI